MTATVHKILVYSKESFENTVHPVGYFGEEAAESINKIYKFNSQDLSAGDIPYTCTAVFIKIAGLGRAS